MSKNNNWIDAADASDEIVVELLIERLGKIFTAERNARVLVIQFDEPVTKPYARWHADAFEQIERLTGAGKSIRQACAEVEPSFMKKHSINQGTLRSAYMAYRHEAAVRDFEVALVAQDIGAAVDAFRRMSQTTQQSMIDKYQVFAT